MVKFVLQCHVVTSIKQSLVLKDHILSCPVIKKIIWIEPLLRCHLSEKTTFPLSQRWPLNTGLTVIKLRYLLESLVFIKVMVPQIQIQIQGFPRWVAIVCFVFLKSIQCSILSCCGGHLGFSINTKMSKGGTAWDQLSF
jgi:hypothetical protein